jgi:gag-polypeptide of LTR copia-type
MLLYIDGSLPQPPPLILTTPPPPSAYWGSQSPSQEEWDQHDAYVQGLIILNVKNPVGHGVKTDGIAVQTWKSLTDHFNAVPDLGLMDAKNRLCVIKYVDGGDLDAHFASLHVAWEKVNNQGGTMTDSFA